MILSVIEDTVSKMASLQLRSRVFRASRLVLAGQIGLLIGLTGACEPDEYDNFYPDCFELADNESLSCDEACARREAACVPCEDDPSRVGTRYEFEDDLCMTEPQDEASKIESCEDVLEGKTGSAPMVMRTFGCCCL